MWSFTQAHSVALPGDFVKGCHQRRSGTTQLILVRQGQRVQDLFPSRRKLYIDFATVGFAESTTYQPSRGQSVDQLDRAVMLDLQPLGEVRDAGCPSAGHALYGK